MPTALKKFEDAEIQLYDVTTFYSEGPAKAKFVDQIRFCRWYGPFYNQENLTSVSFFSLNETGNNEYLLRLTLEFAKKSIVIAQ